MPDLPSLTPEQVAALVPNASNIKEIGRGGQKLVFQGTINGQIYALKFAKLSSVGLNDVDDPMTNDTAIRARREVETMRDCDSPYMVKLGPIELSFTTVNAQQILYYCEEFIEGRDLRKIQEDGRMSVGEVARVGRNIGSAICSLWSLKKVHRDIKPANIMRRSANGDYILLDAGLAFDVDGESISQTPVGTPAYFSPEQWDFGSRRTVLDFRSDMFSLGVTMYFLATGIHPFWSQGDGITSIFAKITQLVPTPPSQLVSAFPEQLEDVILRLLGKSPHLRYRKCDQLISALEGL